MPKQLVIVESPTKARTISRFLGKDFIVESSYGHVRDLPTSKLGVDVENNFEPQYVIPRKANPNVKKLKKELSKADKIILATDEDREGEAIAWHLTKALKLDESKTIERIVFHEITKEAIDEALKNPRAIDMKLVDAQQARRVLDRLVGYKLSPFLWKKMYRGLSAGRVQSVAVRLIAEREREIQNFKPEEYWTIEADLHKADTKSEVFQATLVKMAQDTLDKFAIKNTESAGQIVKDLEGASWTVAEVEKRAITKNVPTPFTTSTLQQEAFRRLGFSARQTMRLAQQLYEGIQLGDGPVGLITYMRTDSVNLSEESLKNARDFLKKEIGDAYALPSPRRFKTKTKGAQEAHEAIRPSDPWKTPESVKDSLEPRQFKLYNLIWRRFIASQMPEALFDATSVDIEATSDKRQATSYIFRTTGSILKFDGFLKIYQTKTVDIILPELTPKETLDLVEIKPTQHFTQPPARFTEASLVKILEKNGIGRPSTYAPIISTIQDRGYVERFERRYLKPTETGFLVNDLLVEHFPQIVDLQFTAKMEENLDEVAEGNIKWQPIIKEFYEPFAKHLEEKYEEVKKHEVQETTEEICEKCEKPMVIKLGRFGKFLACSGFPDCKTTKTLKKAEPEKINMKCPKCVEGDIIIRRTRRGKIFFGCSNYPKCDYASWTDPRLPAKKETENEEAPKEETKKETEEKEDEEEKEGE